MYGCVASCSYAWAEEYVSKSWLGVYALAPGNCLAMALNGYEVALNHFSKSTGDSNECLWGFIFRIRTDILDPSRKLHAKAL